MMLQYSTYSVISPEGCASILWKSADKAADAAEALGLTSGRLYELGLIDRVIQEPRGAAHRDPVLMSAKIKHAILEELDLLQTLDTDTLLQRRYDRLMSFGRFNEAS